MAIDRMFIKCEQCNEATMLAKLGSEGGIISNDWGYNIDDKLNNFFNKHSYCDDRSFKIKYESDDEFDTTNIYDGKEK